MSPGYPQAPEPIGVQDVVNLHRLAAEPRITTRCPSCGCQTLFIGSGGHLVCSLIDCPSPGVERKIAELQAKAERYDAIAALVKS